MGFSTLGSSDIETDIQTAKQIAQYHTVNGRLQSKQGVALKFIIKSFSASYIMI